MKQPNKRVSQEEIPDLIQQLIPVWQKEIDRLQAVKEPTAEDIKLSLQLSQHLMALYTNYRVLKAEIKKELRSLTPDAIAKIAQRQAGILKTPAELD